MTVLSSTNFPFQRKKIKKNKKIITENTFTVSHFV